MPTPDLLLVQVIKQHAGRRLLGISRQVARASGEAMTAVFVATGTGTGINVAYIERLNATFSGVMDPLKRRCRAMARSAEARTADLYLVGLAARIVIAGGFGASGETGSA